MDAKVHIGSFSKDFQKFNITVITQLSIQIGSDSNSLLQMNEQDKYIVNLISSVYSSYKYWLSW